MSKLLDPVEPSTQEDEKTLTASAVKTQRVEALLCEVPMRMCERHFSHEKHMPTKSDIGIGGCQQQL